MNLVNGLQSNSEIVYLAELIKDFPTEKQMQAEAALNTLSVRYEELEKNTAGFLKTVKTPPPQLFKFPFNKLIIEKDYFPAVFSMFVLLFHRYLFHEILSNAGKYRSKKDPNNGLVGFGGNNPRMLGSLNFTGTIPEEIPNLLNKAFKLLRANSNNPIKDGLEFYRRFVRIHPFYDANGRISRLILNIYFQYFGLNINWRELESGGNKTKFIKKLNNCHKTENQLNYKTYFEYLLNHFKKFVVETKDFDLPSP